MTPNYDAIRAEAERLADERADDLQQREAQHNRALLALAAEHPDVPLPAIVLRALSRHYDPALPATPEWLRVLPPAVADREVLRMMGSHPIHDMPLDEQVELVLQTGDPSSPALESERRRAPLIAALVANKVKEEERHQELQRAQKWELEMQLRRGHAIRAAEDAALEKAIPADHRRRYEEQLAKEDELIGRYREAQLTGSAVSVGGAQ